jgi:aspartate-semialdehyde dehydrogenase
MDILDNVIPYIPGEEAKIPAEARKILGSLEQHAKSRPILSMSNPS